jgi:hypothetical protein
MCLLTRISWLNRALRKESETLDASSHTDINYLRMPLIFWDSIDSSINEEFSTGHWRLISVILATWEAAIGRIEVSFGKKLVKPHLNQ